MKNKYIYLLVGIAILVILLFITMYTCNHTYPRGETNRNDKDGNTPEKDSSLMTLKQSATAVTQKKENHPKNAYNKNELKEEIREDRIVLESAGGYSYASIKEGASYNSWNEFNKFKAPGSGILYFSAVAYNDIHVAISDEMRTKNPMYEIVIGGWRNTRSVIRNESQGPAYAVSAKCIQNTGEIQQYWVKLDKSTGNISCGYGNVPGEDIILEWHDSKFLQSAQYIAFSSWDSIVKFSNVKITAIK
jgi:hypothetical protein